MTPRVDVCGKQLIKCAAAAPEDKTAHNVIRVRNQARDLIHFRLSGFRRTLRSNVFNIIPQLLLLFFFFLTIVFYFFDFALLVICNFRSATCQALVLEIGETVQILEKSEGESKDGKCGSEGRWFQLFCILCGNIHSFSRCGSLFIPKLITPVFISLYISKSTFRRREGSAVEMRRSTVKIIY